MLPGGFLLAEVIPVTKLVTANRGNPVYGFHWYGPPGTEFVPQIGVLERKFDTGTSSVEVLDAFRRHTALLERLVADFKAAHP